MFVLVRAPCARRVGAQGLGSPRGTLQPRVPPRAQPSRPFCRVTTVPLHLWLKDRESSLVWDLLRMPSCPFWRSRHPARHNPPTPRHSPQSFPKAPVLSFRGYPGNFHCRLNRDQIIDSSLFCRKNTNSLKHLNSDPRSPLPVGLFTTCPHFTARNRASVIFTQSVFIQI